MYDPWVSVEGAQHEYGITPVRAPQSGRYDAIILAVAHRELKKLGSAGMHVFGKEEHVLCDLKYVLTKTYSDIRL